METILCMVFVTLALTIPFGNASEIKTLDECGSPQFLTVNESGTIQCTFTDYVAVSWYNPEKEKTILLLHEGIKSGEGYNSGQYDIFPNGSLFIQRVTLQQDSLFKVTKVISVKEARSIEYDIQVITVVKPHTSHPVIDKCQGRNTSCFISVYSDGLLNCVIENSRPSINLTWVSRSLANDELLNSSFTSVTYDNTTYTSHSTVEYIISQLMLLNIFVCKANSNPRDLIVNQESIIILDKVINYEYVASPQKKHIEVFASMKLPCSDNSNHNGKPDIFVWKQLLKGHDTWSTILFTFASRDSLTQTYKQGFEVDDEGALFLKTLQTDQEGLYICIFNGGREQDVMLYDVNAFVYPVPAHPVVEGCDQQQYCAIHVTDGDDMKCSIFGIRPEVKLEWIVLGSTDEVTFEVKQYSVKQNKHVFDVTLTSIVSYSQSSRKWVRVACRVIQSESHRFQLSTTVDIQLNVVTPHNQAYLVTIPVLAVVVFSVVVVITIARRRVRQRQEQSPEEYQQELSPMIHNNLENRQPTSGQISEDDFIEMLKAKYKILYDSVQPIPYIKDRMFCVDKVFVESGIEYLVESADARQEDNWNPLDSYHELLSEKMTASGRSILEGEPGYGKSTITLQLAYDWCNSVEESPLNPIKMLIFLRLRQLGGVTSIYQAVRRFILPKDSTLTEEDVKRIIEACDSVFVVLDGYDEYPDQDNMETDISKIILKDIFRTRKVLLTTRSSYLPKKRAPQYSRIRLKGFDDSARDKYIRKAVVGDDVNAAENIQRKLQENPVLGDLCEVPLFFVMFAHITHEHKDLQTFKSVTSFFRFVIQCFHSHMRNKMEEENVTTFDAMEASHSRLDKIAFKALTGENQQIVWKKEKLLNRLGPTFYDQYVKVGILVEDEILGGISAVNLQSDCTVEVRFYHKLLCEWYAAHHLAKCISKLTIKKSKLLVNIDPYDLQYLYRFACGISQEASVKIITYLRKTDEGQKFAILCILEQEGETNDLLESVTDLVSERVIVSQNDTRLLQRSTLQILEFASKKGIPIPSVTLDRSFDKLQNDEIMLTSGISLPKLYTLEKIHIETADNRELKGNDAITIVKHASESKTLREVSFGGCLLPNSLSSTDEFKNSHDVKVTWCRYGYRLNFRSLCWEIDDVSTFRRLCSSDVHIRNTDSELLQKCTIQLLKNASENDISISCVTLNQPFVRVDEDGIILKSRMTLINLLTLEKLHIEREDGENELSEDEVIKICTYALRSIRMTEVSFGGCLLPLSFSALGVSQDLITRNIKVTWSRYGYSYNLTSELWQIDDVSTSERLCSSDVNIQNTDSKLLQECTIQLLENASKKGIPISRVWLTGCSPRVHNSGIGLDSGLSLPILNSLQHLSMSDNNKNMTEKEFVDFLCYSSQCANLKELRLSHGYTLPQNVPRESIPCSLITRNFRVYQIKNISVGIQTNIARLRSVASCVTLKDLTGPLTTSFDHFIPFGVNRYLYFSPNIITFNFEKKTLLLHLQNWVKLNFENGRWEHIKEPDRFSLGKK